MLGSVETISYDGEFVRLVELRLPLRGSTQGQLLSIRTCERIGQGSFGTVYRAVCDGYPKLALKIATGKAARLRQELDVLVKVCTKGKLLLPRFEFGAINKTGDLIVVGMELCVPSTLHDLLLVTRLTNEADMLFLAYQVLQAVACVHEQQCIHRDVKLQNFVFDLDGNLKLIDFGLASSAWNPPPGDVVAGTVSFMAP
ncbi:protein kinase, partial [Trypanosoma cruzi]